MAEKKKILQLRKLKKYFPVNRKQNLKAVEDVSFKMYEGEKFGVVGESGCGKSTLGRVILQLYEQTSGSAVYYGKSVEELNPKYVRQEINKLKEYQRKASEYYQKSLVVDKEVARLAAEKASFDADGSSKDAKRYDKVSKALAKAEFESKELKKNASRQLREGSRTCGSLILTDHLDEVMKLYNQAEDEIKTAHDIIVKANVIKNTLEEAQVVLTEIDVLPKQVEKLEAKGELNEEEQLILKDIKEAINKNASVNIEAKKAEVAKLTNEYETLMQEVKEHKQKALAYREEAYSFRGKDVLPITELTFDPEYQKKLDGNYETGINLNKLTAAEMRSIRRDMQMIFQDPSASLDPRQTIGKAIEEVFVINTDMPAKLRKEKAMQLLEKVGLKREHYYSYPHSLSGGQKQRVGIARAVALDPSFIVLDEAVSALDVSVKAQILQLLNELSEEKHLTYFFITHDLGVAKHFCDRIMVMYLGNICELAPSKELFANRLHPYTDSLLDSVPRLKIGEERKKVEILEGEVPSAINPPSGCPFHTRCKKCMEICKKEKPKYIEALPNHFVACHLYDEKENN